jgi:hypothetical protein
MKAEKLILISISNVILHTISKTKKGHIKKVTKREIISLCHLCGLLSRKGITIHQVQD